MCFSKYFSNYLINNGVSINKLSRITGIDRSSLYRYQNGNRLPRSFDVVVTLANALNMNTNERMKLFEEFDKSAYGEDVVNSFIFTMQLMKKIRNETSFSSLASFSTISAISGDWQENERCVQLFTSRDITVYTMRMFKKTIDNKGFVKLSVEPTINCIQELILPFFANTDIPVEQIIYFEKSMEKCYLNLELLSSVIPVSFSVKNYKAFYQYGNIADNGFDNFLFSNAIVTENSAIVFNSTLTSGFFTTDPIILKTITDTFNHVISNLFSLIEEDNFMNVIDDLYFSTANSPLYTLFNQPCFGPCLDSAILKNSIHDFPYKDELIAAMFRQYGDWNGSTHISNNSYLLYFESYFTKNGLTQFAKTGIINEFPEELHHPLPVSARLDVIKRMLILMENKRCYYHLFKNDFILPNNIHLYCEFNSRVIWFRSISTNKMVQINTNEQSLLNTLLNAKNYVEKKELVCTKEELVAFINSLIISLEKMECSS